ncbi:MAG: TlpA family protein disulfide reductase [Acidiphilium sp.]
MTMSAASRRGFLVLTASGAALGLPRSGAAAVPNAPPLYITEPKPLPAFKFSDASGHPLTLADFHGKFVLLNIWATWCIPCRKEMPTLDRLQAKFGGPHFEVVPVSIDSGGLTAARKFYAEIKIEHLGIFLDPSGSAMQVLNLEGVPTRRSEKRRLPSISSSFGLLIRAAARLTRLRMPPESWCG